MKLKAELENIKQAFKANINQIMAYALCLKAHGGYNNFETRLTWDCLRTYIGTETICEWYDKYGCNDTHITTAGKAVLKELGVI